MGKGKGKPLHFIRHIGRRGQIMLAGVLAVCLLTGAPAANAVFTRTLNAGTTTVGTYTLASPTGNDVRPLCTTNGNGSGKYKLTLTVVSYGPVAKANNYVMTVKDSTGLVIGTVQLSQTNTYTAPGAGSRWTYSIDAQYKVPGTSNVWTSAPNPVTVC